MVSYDGGWPETPMPTWDPADVEAHLAYYKALNDELALDNTITTTKIKVWLIPNMSETTAHLLAKGPTSTAQAQCTR